MKKDALKKRKLWRLAKYGNQPVEEMSPTTRRLFRKWGHRAYEIYAWQKKNGW